MPKHNSDMQLLTSGHREAIFDVTCVAVSYLDIY